MINSESTEECVKSIEECLSACNTDSIKRAGNLFLNSKFDLHEEYVALTKEKLSAEVSKVDYSNSVAAAGIINDWVSEKTDGLIDTLISPDMISDLTLLTLVTAILFKGKWEEKFETAGEHDFRSTSGKTEEVKKAKFMNLFVVLNSDIGVHFWRIPIFLVLSPLPLQFSGVIGTFSGRGMCSLDARATSSGTRFALPWRNIAR